MLKKAYLCNFLLFILLSPFLSRGEEISYPLGTIVVTATRIPQSLSSLTRSVTVINKEEIENVPVESVPELLEYVSGVDVRRRGVYGVQADVGIRGSDFEQVLILINGIRANDPQTGHHNMDLPLTLADIERIEVLRGGGSSLYGPNALGGVINIITKEPEKREGELKLSFGDYALSQEAVSLSFPLKKFKNRISFEKKKSEGYIENTEFDITTLSLNSQIGSFGLSFGLTDKEFGADSFYSNLYPQEYEETKTRFAQIRTKVEKGRITLEPKIYYRKHWDKFILDRTRPDWYVNYHTTYLYGGEIQSRILSPFGSFVFGGEIGEERIESTNLGDHSRLREALYLEFSRKTQDKLFLNLGIRGDHYSDWEWEGSPSLSLGYKVSPFLKLRTSLGRSFRVPTFTDLYYESPANIGNPDLKPERAWSYEIGLDYMKKNFHWGNTLFIREGDDLIDWIRENPESPWKAENIGEVRTKGIETILSFPSLSFSYAYLDAEKEGEIISKYALDHLKHHFSLGITHSFFGFSQNLRLSYKERVEEGYFLLDARISKKINNIELFLQGTNLLNTSYREREEVPLPGIWVQGGIKIFL